MHTTDKYILDGKNPKPIYDLMEWAEWYGKANRVVKQTAIEEAEVSTVFLSMDHNFGFSDSPVLFETMIFGGEHDGYQERYSTWDQAEAGHEVACNLVKGETNE